MTECTKKVLLTVTTGIFACISFGCLVVAVSTDYWLHALERYADEKAGGNITFKVTTTGLWRTCVEHEHKTKPRNCSYINYFMQQDKDGLGPTEAILISLRKSTLFPLISLLMLLAGEVVCIMSHCDRRKKVLTFISGILFVVAGLLTLIGIILYIGAITEEAGNHTKSSMDNHPRFEYWYGASFVLTVTSFSSAELTGVLSVYLYISRHKHSYRKKVERLQSSSTANLDGEVSGGGAGGGASAVHANHSPATQAAAAPHSRSNGRANGTGGSANLFTSSSNPGGGAGGGAASLGAAPRPASAGPSAYGPASGGCSGRFDTTYSFSPISAASGCGGAGTLVACDGGGFSGGGWRTIGSRETLAGDGTVMMMLAREPSRHTLASTAAADWVTPNHLRYPAAQDSYRRTTPV